MTLQTDIAQIQALCVKILADNATPGPDVIVTAPEPVTGKDIIAVYDTEFIKCDLIRPYYNQIRRDFFLALNIAAKASGVIWKLMLACPPTDEPDTVHFKDGLRADFRYPKLTNSRINVPPIQAFVDSLDSQRAQMEYVMAKAIKNEWVGENRKIVFSDTNGHDKHADVYWGLDK